MLAAPQIRIKPLSVFSEFSSHLTEKYFYIMLGLAVFVHILGFGIYQLLPHEEIIQIPVKALNIKLGGGEATALATQESAPAPTAPAPEPIVAAPQPAKLVPPPPPAAADTIKNDLPVKPRRISNAAAARANALPSEYVRQGAAPAGPGDPLGNTSGEGGEEVMRRYEQVLSLWIERHKVYPAMAREQGMEGDAVIRIRLNREGQIILLQLEKPTPYRVLNDAIEDMVRSANPAPAVPSNYPGGDRFEFLVPVSFRLQ